MSNQPKMGLAQAFNIVAPAARSCQATGEQHEMIVSALLAIKEVVEAVVAAEQEAAKSAPTLKAVDAAADKPKSKKASKAAEETANA